jgi:hypothetical protein
MEWDNFKRQMARQILVRTPAGFDEQLRQEFRKNRALFPLDADPEDILNNMHVEAQKWLIRRLRDGDQDANGRGFTSIEQANKSLDRLYRAGVIQEPDQVQAIRDALTRQQDAMAEGIKERLRDGEVTLEGAMTAAHGNKEVERRIKEYKAKQMKIDGATPSAIKIADTYKMQFRTEDGKRITAKTEDTIKGAKRKLDIMVGNGEINAAEREYIIGEIEDYNKIIKVKGVEDIYARFGEGRPIHEVMYEFKNELIDEANLPEEVKRTYKDLIDAQELRYNAMMSENEADIRLAQIEKNSAEFRRNARLFRKWGILFVLGAGGFVGGGFIGGAAVGGVGAAGGAMLGLGVGAGVGGAIAGGMAVHEHLFDKKLGELNAIIKNKEVLVADAQLKAKELGISIYENTPDLIAQMIHERVGMSLDEARNALKFLFGSDSISDVRSTIASLVPYNPRMTGEAQAG